MKKYITAIFIILAIFSNTQVYADTLTLDECYEMNRLNFPVSKTKGLQKEITARTLQQLNRNWYPQLNVSGQAVYQSDVVDLNIDLPVSSFTFPEVPHDQYKIYLDIHQHIYDGGMTGLNKQLTRAEFNEQLARTEVDVYKMREQINSVYFMKLLLQEQEIILQNSKKELTNRLDAMEAGFKNGVVLLSDLNIIKAELLKLENKICDNQVSQNVACELLSILTGLSVDGRTTLIQPDFDFQKSHIRQRPEYKLYEQQKQVLDANMALMNASNRPKLFAFGQLGYGKPGLNFFNENFDTYYIVGAGLSWNIYDWGKKQQRKEVLLIRKDIIEVRKDILDKHLSVSEKKVLGEIHKLEKTLENDKEIIVLRGEVTESASLKLENGVITSTDFLTEYNAEVQARLNYKIHHIQLSRKKVEYLTLIGGL